MHPSIGRLGGVRDVFKLCIVAFPKESYGRNYETIIGARSDSFIMMWVAFAKGVGNFGNDPTQRKVKPRGAVCKYGHTGNYLFSNLTTAEAFRPSHKKYVAVISLKQLRFVIKDIQDVKRKLLKEGFAPQNEFRLRKDERTFTLGVVFHNGSLPEKISDTSSEVCVKKSKPGFSIVVKRENMDGTRLDPEHRIPWGVVSGLVGENATARSMRTLVGMECRFNLREV